MASLATWIKPVMYERGLAAATGEMSLRAAFRDTLAAQTRQP
jgi:hypothetical protein